ncbi:hypothetical protein SKAU_G00089420 [Synaphobranchus kaupii]|uniref:E2F/DP family winged-helix DNA-binding domain-containing protein n=1 Tax=Synaphobranchus kaupii TaxID=118154 RepID=A0A9Q1J5Z8_SYNKA|nr:hypothetical protein SKAU_G00089420 [Synaphobranchus kaupii]
MPHSGCEPAKRKLDLEDPLYLPEFRTPKGKGCAAAGPEPQDESTDGVLDLNWATEVLEVQKRRIYDITNVLEGVQLIRKKSKNNIQWMAQRAAPERARCLRKELEHLERAEKSLDDLVQSSTSQLRDLTENQDSQRYPSSRAATQPQGVDIRSIASLQDQTVIAVKAPAETKLEVPETSGDTLQIYLKSKNGPIEVYLCPEEGQEDGSPVKGTTPKKEAPLPVTENPQYTVKQEPLEAEISKPAGTEPAVDSSRPMLDVERILGLPPSLLLITEDQLPGSAFAPEATAHFAPEAAAPFVSFSPPLDHDDYLWSLEDGEGERERSHCGMLGQLPRRLLFPGKTRRRNVFVHVPGNATWALVGQTGILPSLALAEVRLVRAVILLRLVVHICGTQLALPCQGPGAGPDAVLTTHSSGLSGRNSAVIIADAHLDVMLTDARAAPGREHGLQPQTTPLPAPDWSAVNYVCRWGRRSVGLRGRGGVHLLYTPGQNFLLHAGKPPPPSISSAVSRVTKHSMLPLATGYPPYPFLTGRTDCAFASSAVVQRFLPQPASSRTAPTPQPPAQCFFRLTLG